MPEATHARKTDPREGPLLTEQRHDDPTNAARAAVGASVGH